MKPIHISKFLKRVTVESHAAFMFSTGLILRTVHAALQSDRWSRKFVVSSHLVWLAFPDTKYMSTHFILRQLNNAQKESKRSIAIDLVKSDEID